MPRETVTAPFPLLTQLGHGPVPHYTHLATDVDLVGFRRRGERLCRRGYRTFWSGPEHAPSYEARAFSDVSQPLCPHCKRRLAYLEGRRPRLYPQLRARLEHAFRNARVELQRQGRDPDRYVPRATVEGLDYRLPLQEALLREWPHTPGSNATPNVPDEGIIP